MREDAATLGASGSVQVFACLPDRSRQSCGTNSALHQLCLHAAEPDAPKVPALASRHP